MKNWWKERSNKVTFLFKRVSCIHPLYIKLLVPSGSLCSLEHVEASSLLFAYEILTFPGLVSHCGMSFSFSFFLFYWFLLSLSLRLGYFILVDSFLLVLFDGIRIGVNVEDVPLLQEDYKKEALKATVRRLWPFLRRMIWRRLSLKAPGLLINVTFF